MNEVEERHEQRAYFELILKERDKRDDERDKRLDERFQAQETAVQFALTEREKAVNAALTAAKEAVQKAEEAAKETLKSHNDLIRQSRDRDATYATQSDVHHVNESIQKLEGFQSRMLGALGLVLVVIPLVTVVVSYLLTRHTGPQIITVTVPTTP
jgi:phosphopantetheinyl transferase (holo-ACP synthase)